MFVKGIFEEIVFKNLPGSYFLSGSMRRKRLLIGEVVGKKIISDFDFVFQFLLACIDVFIITLA